MSGAAGPATGMEAMTEAFDSYAAMGLRVPSVPHDLVAALVDRGDDVFATSDMSLDSREAFLALADDPEAPDDIGFGQIGHGINSWWFCLRLRTPTLALYVRMSFGGAYGDAEAERRRVNGMLRENDELVVAAMDGAEAGRLPPGSRVIVVYDERDGSFWQAPGQDRVAEDDPYQAAMAWLAAT